MLLCRQAKLKAINDTNKAIKDTHAAKAEEAATADTDAEQVALAEYALTKMPRCCVNQNSILPHDAATQEIDAGET